MNIFKNVAISLAAVVAVCASSVSFAEEHVMPPMPKPTQEHAWLKQLVGDWTATTEAYVDPAQPPMVTKGTEKVTALGEFWTLTNIESDMMGQPFHGQMTLGYDAKAKKYIGTWVDSMTGKLWQYEGQVDASGKKLTLTSEGECPCLGGKNVKIEESVELKDADHKVFTSKMLLDGKWVTNMVSTAERVK